MYGCMSICTWMYTVCMWRLDIHVYVWINVWFNMLMDARMYVCMYLMRWLCYFKLSLNVLCASQVALSPAMGNVLYVCMYGWMHVRMRMYCDYIIIVQFLKAESNRFKKFVDPLLRLTGPLSVIMVPQLWRTRTSINKSLGGWVSGNTKFINCIYNTINMYVPHIL